MGENHKFIVWGPEPFETTYDDIEQPATPPSVRHVTSPMAYRIPLGNDFRQARWVGQGTGEGRKSRDAVRGTVQETKGLQHFHPVYGDQFVI